MPAAPNPLQDRKPWGVVLFVGLLITSSPGHGATLPLRTQAFFFQHDTDRPASRAEPLVSPTAPPAATETSLPDIPSLMRAVEAHQRAEEDLEKDYLYHSIQIVQETDSHGKPKKSAIEEYDVFWIHGVPVRKMTRKDGRELTPDELKKEDDHIDKEVEKANEKREKEDAKGKQTDPRGNEEITVSRFLELGSFTNPRRIPLNGRDTIVVDYAGDPNAKTRNKAEDMVRDLQGTLWIDEQDKVISKAQGHFLKSFKIGGGLLVNIRQNTSFGMEQKKINDEVWLPNHIEGDGAARMLLLFNFNGNVRVENSGYRKFKATSRILPGLSTVQEQDAGPPSQ